MKKEVVYEINESELNKIFAFIVSKPLQESIELYNICQEIGKRVVTTDEVEMKSSKQVDAG